MRTTLAPICTAPAATARPPDPAPMTQRSGVSVASPGMADCEPKRGRSASPARGLFVPLLVLVFVGVAERREFREMLDLLLDHLALALDKRRDRAAKAGIGDPVGAVGRRRQIAALQFMGALGARFDALQPALAGELDRPVIAAFEMQEAVFAVRPPVAPVDRVAAEDVEGAGDVVLAAPRHEQDHLV